MRGAEAVADTEQARLSRRLEKTPGIKQGKAFQLADITETPRATCVNRAILSMPADPLVSAKDIALSVGGGVTARTVIRWAKMERIPCVRVNARVIRFDCAAVRKKLRQRAK